MNRCTNVPYLIYEFLIYCIFLLLLLHLQYIFVTAVRVRIIMFFILSIEEMIRVMFRDRYDIMFLYL